MWPGNRKGKVYLATESVAMIVPESSSIWAVGEITIFSGRVMWPGNGAMQREKFI